MESQSQSTYTRHKPFSLPIRETRRKARAQEDIGSHLVRISRRSPDAHIPPLPSMAQRLHRDASMR